MENALTLENITRMLLTVEKIRKMHGKDLGENEAVIVRKDNLTTVYETLQLLAEFLPATRTGSFIEALQKSSGYSRAYRDIKRHVRTEGSSKVDFIKVAKAVKAVSPVMDNRQKVFFGKIAGIIDILNS